MSVKKMLLLMLVLLAGSDVKIKAQCFCADARFRIVLPGLKQKGRQRNYTIHTLTGDNLFKRNSFFDSEIKGDTVSFRYPTGGGLDSLSFIIENRGKKKMTVTALHLDYDINYTIDLTTFTPGSFLFDWNIIGPCQNGQRDSFLVQCGQMSFYQLEIAEPNDHFVPHHIRPFDLMLFKQD